MRQDTIWIRLEIATCFIIWTEKCARIFREQRKTHLALVTEILLEYQE